MTGFEAAIADRDWERAALYLLYGLTCRAAALPPGTLAELLTLLGGDGDPTPRHRRSLTGRRPRRQRGSP